MSTVFVRAFNPQSVPLWNQVAMSHSGGYSTVAMDGQDNFVVAWQVANLTTNPDMYFNNANGPAINDETSTDVFATEYQLLNYNNLQPLAAPAVIRNTFRVNQRQHEYHNADRLAIRRLCGRRADGENGDIAVSYHGNGPAVSEL